MSEKLLGLILILAAALSALLIIRKTAGKRALKARLREVKKPYDIAPGMPDHEKKGGRAGNGFLGGLKSSLNENFYSAGLRMNTSAAAAIWILLVIFAPLIIYVSGGGIAIYSTAAVLMAAMPFVLMQISRNRRARKFEEQLVGAIEVMNSALKAGYSFQSSLRVVADASEDPAREEFTALFNEIQLGARFDDALKNLSKRIGSRDVDIFCTALIVQSATGGNLVMVLANIAETIRTRIKIRKEINAKTSSGKLSGLIVGALPFILFLIIRVMNPNYIMPFIQRQEGRRILLGAGALMIAGFLIIRNIVDVEY